MNYAVDLHRANSRRAAKCATEDQRLIQRQIDKNKRQIEQLKASGSRADRRSARQLEVETRELQRREVNATMAKLRTDE